MDIRFLKFPLHCSAQRTTDDNTLLTSVIETNIYKGESTNMNSTWAAIYLEFVEWCDTKYMFSHSHKNQDYWLQEFSEDVFSYTEYLLILSVPTEPISSMMWKVPDLMGTIKHMDKYRDGKLGRVYVSSRHTATNRSIVSFKRCIICMFRKTDNSIYSQTVRDRHFISALHNQAGFPLQPTILIVLISSIRIHHKPENVTKFKHEHSHRADIMYVTITYYTVI